jgi:hypothetical protein
MKEHFCPVEQSMIAYEGECNWCSQKEWVGLTDEEISELRLKTFDAVATNHEVYRAIEAKLKDKNT